MNGGTAQIIRGNALELPIEDGSVDLICTSPPYFSLRSYQDTCPACRDLERTGDDPREAFPDWSEHTRKFHHYAGQLGSEATPAEFVDALIAATREMVRVLRPSGSIWVNLGDKYANAAPSGTAGKRVYASGPLDWSETLPPIRTDNAGIRAKSLIGIPWRYAIRCIDELGLILRAEVIWSKPNGLPESVTDRVRRSHEQWFHFVTQPRYFAAVDEIREECAPPSATALRGPTFGFKSNGDRGDLGAGNFMPSPLGKLPGSVWTVPTQPLRVPEHLGVDHFAAFPMEWPRRIILGWSPSGVCVECGQGRRPVVDKRYLSIGDPYSRDTAPNGGLSIEGRHRLTKRAGDGEVATITGYACACPDPTAPTTPATILDPFGGTGTTALVAKALGRHGVSVDMSADYCRLAQWRCSDEGELARAMQVEKPAKQIEGQADLFALIAEDGEPA